MKILVRLSICLVALLFAESSRGQNTPTIAQCTDTANRLLPVDSDSKFVQLAESMTAGDELTLSTRLARCQEAYSRQLNQTQLATLDRMVYRLDADIISRMYQFLERHRLADKFNDEEEAKRKKS